MCVIFTPAIAQFQDIGRYSPASYDRAGVAQRAGCRFYDRSGQPSCAASSGCHNRSIPSRCFLPSDAPAEMMCFGPRGFFWPISNPLFQGRWSLRKGHSGIRVPPPPNPPRRSTARAISQPKMYALTTPKRTSLTDRFWRAKRTLPMRAAATIRAVIARAGKYTPAAR